MNSDDNRTSELPPELIARIRREAQLAAATIAAQAMHDAEQRSA